MLSPEQEAALLSDLLKKKLPDKFSARQLSGKAHWRWNRGEHLEAAVLFAAAASRCSAENRLVPTMRDETFNYHIRSGVNFRLAGEVERAWPILMEAVTFDWNAAGIPEDSHFVEWAFVEMLQVLAIREDRREFSNMFWLAVTRCRELGRSFPEIHPKQDLLLDLCDRLGLARELAHVIERVESQRKITRPLARRLAQLNADQLADVSERPS